MRELSHDTNKRFINGTENFFCITSKNTKKGLQIVSESFIKWLGENEHLSVKIFKQIIANYDRNRVLTVNYVGTIYGQYVLRSTSYF